jgi:hypothetical protein
MNDIKGALTKDDFAFLIAELATRGNVELKACHNERVLGDVIVKLLEALDLLVKAETH